METAAWEIPTLSEIVFKVGGISEYSGLFFNIKNLYQINEKYQELANIVSEIEGVKSVCIERQGVALAAGKKGRTGATVRGVSPSLYEKNESFRKYLNILEGEFDVSTSKDAVIGSKLAKDLNLKLGDTIRIISSRSNSSGKVVPRFSTFKVKGICSSGYQELDALWVFINAKTAFDIFSTTPVMSSFK